MKARWIAAAGLLVVLGAITVRRPRTAHPVRNSAADRGPPRSWGLAADRGAAASSDAAPGRPSRPRPSRPRPRDSAAITAHDRDLAAMSDAIEASRTARTEAQRLASDELGLDDPTRAAIATIFAQEREAVAGLAATTDATSDVVHGDLIAERRRRLAELLGQPRADEFNEVYTRHWIDLLSAVFP